MARMYPQRLPDSVPMGAERTLYGELERQLPAEYVVLYGVKWIQRDRRMFDQDGEADFVIVDPKRGALVLEVKGGAVRRNGFTGRFQSVDFYGRVWDIKDPMEQAMKNKHALKNKIETSRPTARYARQYRLEHAVAFPEVVVEETNLGTEWDRGKIIDSTNLADLTRAVQGALGKGEQMWHLEPGAVEALVQLLAPSWQIERPGLLGRMLPEQERFLELTEQQFLLLDALSAHRRYAVAGCAGSGKTFLAIGQARRLAREGYKVLFTCFNQALADWVRAELERGLADTGNAPYVDNYHDVAAEYCRRARLSLRDPDPLPDEEKSRYYNEELPAEFSEALDALPESEKFDAVIVDEAQDFRSGWWITLLDALRDPDSGLLYIFYDSNQRIFSPDSEFPIPEPHFPLRANLRNTQAIHKLAMRYHSDPLTLSSRGPQGREHEEVQVEPGKDLQALRRVVTRLLGEGIRPEDMVVLTPRSQKSSALADGADAGNRLRLSWSGSHPGTVRVRTVHAFKGLEAPVVILAEPERVHAGRREHILYVALSRARHHLVVLGKLLDGGSPAPTSEERGKQGGGPANGSIWRGGDIVVEPPAATGQSSI